MNHAFTAKNTKYYLNLQVELSNVQTVKKSCR